MTTIPDGQAHPADTAPGDAPLDAGGIRASIIGYGVGLALATGLSLCSFLIARFDLVYVPALPVALIVFAIAQMGVHLVFFIHINTGPDNTNNVLALAFGVLIVLLLLAGSLFIMSNLNARMMPMEQVMQMQR